MEAKEKAKEIVEKYELLLSPTMSSMSNQFSVDLDMKGSMYNAKQCALIAVDEKIKLVEEEMIGIDWNIRKIFIDELNEVKTEINNLTI